MLSVKYDIITPNNTPLSFLALSGENRPTIGGFLSPRASYTGFDISLILRKQTIEQNVELPVIEMPKCSYEQAVENSPVAGDLKRHDAHVTSL